MPMRAKIALVPALAVAVTGCFLFRSPPPDRLPNPARDEMVGALRRDIERRLPSIPGAAGLWFRDLDTDETLAFNADRVFSAPGVTAAFVLIEAFKRAYEGTLDLDDAVDVADTFPTAGGGTFRVDDCARLARKVGARTPARRLCEEMISASSPCAANNLIRLLGSPDPITATAHALGASRSKVPCYALDEKAFQAGLRHETTPADIGRVLEQLARMQVIRPESSQEIVHILTLCEGGFLGRDLPAGQVEIAHLTEASAGLRHDTGFIRSENGTYVLAVLMQDLKDEKAGEDAAAAISKACYDYIQKRPR